MNIEEYPGLSDLEHLANALTLSEHLQAYQDSLVTVIRTGHVIALERFGFHRTHLTPTEIQEFDA